MKTITVSFKVPQESNWSDERIKKLQEMILDAIDRNNSEGEYQGRRGSDAYKAEKSIAEDLLAL